MVGIKWKNIEQRRICVYIFFVYYTKTETGAEKEK